MLVRKSVQLQPLNVATPMIASIRLAGVDYLRFSEKKRFKRNLFVRDEMWESGRTGMRPLQTKVVVNPDDAW